MPSAQAAGHSLSYEFVGAAKSDPTLVFLHEGLGSIRQWRDFPARVADATGCRALVYDRYGYGQSDVLQEKRRSVQFMHDEAHGALPELLSHLQVERPVLVGHSDGASIALIYAGSGAEVRGVAVMAPHVFIERICLDSIQKVNDVFEKSDLRQRLGKYHRDAAKTFYGWADVWLDPDFERWDIRDDFLPKVTAPVLAIQGCDDEYGTMRQLDEIRQRVRGPCELLKLENCGHTPFRDRPEETLLAVQAFIKRIL
jgi:pimeloyl-ACP methyl ester carboxylesterase